MIDNLSYYAELRNILADISRRPCENIGLDDDLFAAGVLDSFGIIEFVMALEKHFHCAIPQDMLLPQNLWSIRAVSDTLSRVCIS